jgi:hypothetical protein
LALVATFLACFRDYTEYLAPGEVATIAILAADRRQARTIFRFTSGLFESVPLLSPMVMRRTDETIELDNRVVIEIGTASFRTTRGYAFAAVLCDEIAFWQLEEASANPDVEILRALRPGMASIPGSVLLLASSPYAKKGELYNAYRRHYGNDNGRVLVWKATTREMNPSIDQAIIAQAYESDPEAARAEYGAEFRDDLADFVTRETVDAVTMRGRSELPPQPGVTYAAFCDPSGGVPDPMTLAIGHLGTGAACVLDAVLEIRAPFDPEQAVANCAAVLRRFAVSRVTGDRYAGEWPKARFREHGIAYEASARTKSDIYLDLLPLLNARRVELLDIPRLGAQLAGLERRTARSGKDSVDHIPGGHDDLANSVAGVLVGLDLDRRPALMRADDLMVAGEGAPMPSLCDTLYAVLAVGDDGACATVYAAYSPLFGIRLTLLDFDVVSMGAGLFGSIGGRLRELGRECRVRLGMALLVPEALVWRAREAGADIVVSALPPAWVDDAGGLGLVAAGHAAAGNVKMSVVCAAKALTEPFRGALDLRGGEGGEAPLRCAALFAIAAALEDERAMRRAG